ncbi:hypothetical protein [Novosphingobium album (ex Liu et al. 2023)]|uniref:Uncharacterized protein n=1 Tax=Novosphingobium album (ex Liu et al. 2023) TaxID=3031130 RepID=A0ABT5WM26_9SPHN|nr:hypothetical protein [Novosphingobium album (ex Liu et al. 2023)]MDE8651091.1 hypothetical protein [Novosphingobium album (ex Liu et al. 2023)]
MALSDWEVSVVAVRSLQELIVAIDVTVAGYDPRIVKVIDAYRAAVKMLETAEELPTGDQIDALMSVLIAGGSRVLEGPQ